MTTTTQTRLTWTKEHERLYTVRIGDAFMLNLFIADEPYRPKLEILDITNQCTAATIMLPAEKTVRELHHIAEIKARGWFQQQAELMNRMYRTMDEWINPPDQPVFYQ